MPYEIDWNAVSAIGQVAGSLITAIAIIIALRKDKPQIYLYVPVKYDEGKSAVQVIVTNTGYIPVTISTVTRLSFKQVVLQIFEITGDPYLAPGEKRMIAEIKKESYTENELKQIWNTLCVIDHTGRIYFTQDKLFPRIRKYLLIKLPAYIGLRHVPRI
jgi:hypothetical protein